MTAIYAPASDGNDPAGYAATVRSMWATWYANNAGYTGTAPTPPPTGTTKIAVPILLVAGHRSTLDGGSPTERALTDDLARAYDAAFKAAGFSPVVWFQRDVDGDSMPDMTVGSLSTVASGCGNWLMSRTEPWSVMLDLHYNGSTSPVHAIVPDCVGLSSGFVGGAPADDIPSVNINDTPLASGIARGIVQRNPGMTLYGSNGVMSERSTGVGGGGDRLGMFGGTAKARKKAIRLVVEHGGTNDATRTDFYNRCAAAAVAAVKATVPGANVVVTPPPVDPDPEPEPDPGLTWPTGLDERFAKALFGKVGTYEFNPNGNISKAWRLHWASTGRAPKLENVYTHADNGSKVWQFSDGTLWYQETPSDTPVILVDWTP
jgi:hypothetical protein